MKKLNLLLLALLCCVVYSCSKDDDPVTVSYLSGTFTPGGSHALVATVDGAAVTSGEVKLTVNPEKQSEGVMVMNNVVSGTPSLSVDVSLREITVDNPAENAVYYEITGGKTVDGKTVDCKGVLMAEPYSQTNKSLTLVVTVK